MWSLIDTGSLPSCKITPWGVHLTMVVEQHSVCLSHLVEKGVTWQWIVLSNLVKLVTDSDRAQHGRSSTTFTTPTTTATTIATALNSPNHQRLWPHLALSDGLLWSTALLLTLPDCTCLCCRSLAVCCSISARERESIQG